MCTHSGTTALVTTLTHTAELKVGGNESHAQNNTKGGVGCWDAYGGGGGGGGGAQEIKESTFRGLIRPLFGKCQFLILAHIEMSPA